MNKEHIDRIDSYIAKLQQENLDVWGKLHQANTILRHLESVLSEEGVLDSLCCYTQAIEMVNLLEKYKEGVK